MIQKTLILLKPDAVQKSLIGEITSRFEKKGLKVIGMKMMQLQDATLQAHYGHLAEKPFFPRIISYMTQGPVVAMALEGEDVVNVVRQMCGATNPNEATMGTIRADFARNMDNNIIHASDSPENAEIELHRFFNVANEIYSYKRELADF